MICCSCGVHVEEDEIGDDLWWPTFWAGEEEYEGPICPKCYERDFFHDDETVSVVLLPGRPLPHLAILSRPHPNLRHHD